MEPNLPNDALRASGIAGQDEERHVRHEPTGLEIYEAACEEWYAVLARLWPAFGKPLDETMLAIYGRELADVPLGLLEPAVSRCVREHGYASVPTVAEVWAAVRRELGNPPGELPAALDRWREALWTRTVTRF